MAEEESYRQEVKGGCMRICVYVEEYKRKAFHAMKVMEHISGLKLVPDKTKYFKEYFKDSKYIKCARVSANIGLSGA